MSRSFIWPIVITFTAATAGAQSAPDDSAPAADEPAESEASATADDDSMPAAPPPVEERAAAPAPSGDTHTAPTLDRFREALDPYGRWVQTPEYGLVWVPSNVDSQWRPYANGHWEDTDEGWTFVANEPWGWAPFHYGRWVYYPAHGWSWLPGYEWAPAWVTWRYGAGTVAWAPLGPVGVSVAYYGLPSLWLAVSWPLFFRPLYWGCFYPTTRIGVVFRETYFAGVPRRGHYYAPPRTYFANRGSEWRREGGRAIGGARGWDGRGRRPDVRGAPPSRTMPRDSRSPGYHRGPRRSTELTPSGPARSATYIRTLPPRSVNPASGVRASAGGGGPRPSVGLGGPSGGRPSVGSAGGGRAGSGGHGGGGGRSGGGHGGSGRR